MVEHSERLCFSRLAGLGLFLRLRSFGVTVECHAMVRDGWRLGRQWMPQFNCPIKPDPAPLFRPG
jgi:hypothetical protein